LLPTAQAGDFHALPFAGHKLAGSTVVCNGLSISQAV
jgi:hypothetical protein